MLLQTVHRVTQRRRLGNCPGFPLRHHLPRLGLRVRPERAALLDIATNFASGEEAIGATFPDNDAKGKQRDKALEASAPHLPKKKKKGRQGKQEVLEADLVAAAEHKNP